MGEEGQEGESMWGMKGESYLSFTTLRFTILKIFRESYEIKNNFLFNIFSELKLI